MDDSPAPQVFTPDQLAARIVARNDFDRRRGPDGHFAHRLDSGDGAGPDPNHRTRSKLAKEAGVSQSRIERARTIQRADPYLLNQVASGTITMGDALAMVKAAAVLPPPFPAGDDQPRRGRPPEDHVTKDRMIRVLSRVHGLCRGFDTLSIPALRNTCDAKEIKEWAGIARSAARALRGFAADLLEESGVETHHQIENDLG